MEDILLYILLALGGVILFQKKKIRNLESEAVDVKDIKLQNEQEKIQEEKKEIEKEVKDLKPKNVDKEEKAEDYWKDKI